DNCKVNFWFFVTRTFDVGRMPSYDRCARPGGSSTFWYAASQPVPGRSDPPGREATHPWAPTGARNPAPGVAAGQPDPATTGWLVRGALGVLAAEPAGCRVFRPARPTCTSFPAVWAVACSRARRGGRAGATRAAQRRVAAPGRHRGAGLADGAVRRSVV